MLYVDSRWKGQHGIGRFASEVMERLAVKWSPLLLRGDPWDALDPIRGRRLSFRSTDTIYSPGFNAGLTRASQLLTVHDLMHLKLNDESSLMKKIYYGRFVKPAIRHAGAVMTVSESSRTEIEAWLGDDAIQIEVVGNGISPAFSVDGPIDARVTDAYLFVGNLKPHKNFDLVVQMLKLRPEIRVFAVATDPTAMQSRVVSEGVGDRVQVLHDLPDEDLAAVYRGSRGLIFPSKMEGFGLPALEAVACGIPVFYWAGVPSVAEIVGTAGYAFHSSEDPDSLLEVLDLNEECVHEPPAPSWLDRYRWDAVGARVSGVLKAYTGGQHG